MANLDALRQAGMQIDDLPAEQQQALNTLEQSEIDTLVSIRTKLEANRPEVTGLAMEKDPIGLFIW